MTTTESSAAPPRRRRARPAGWENLAIYLPGAVLLAMILLSFLGPWLFRLPGPTDGNLADARLPAFSEGHLLGTDAVGNDLLALSVRAGQVSFIVGGVSVVVALLIGAGIGVAAGFARGPLEGVLLRVIDVLLSFPSIVLALALAAYLGPGLFNVIFAVAVFNIPANARLARAATLRVMPMDYITSTRLLGHGSWYIVTRHVAPNIIGELFTYNTVRIGTAMIIEATLSFLGAGVRPPTPSWGSMISKGSQSMATHPEGMLVPSAFLVVAVLCVTVLGDTLRARWERR